MYIASPLEQFEVFEIIGLHTFIGYTFAISNLGLYALLVVVVVSGLHFSSLINNNEVNLVPSRWAIGLESVSTSINSIVKEQISSSKEIYTPFLYAIFLLVLVGNLFSNVPYNYSIASSAMFALGLSVMLWMGNTILAISKHRLHFFSFFLPAGTPTVLIPLLFAIEMISYISRAFSLGIRLFANLVSGHSLLGILAGMIYQIMNSSYLAFVASVIPLVIFIALVGLEIAVSFIQAFVLTILLASYIKDSEYLH